MTVGTVRKTSRNSVWLLAGQILAQSLGFFFAVLIARSLGTDLFGRYLFAAALASFLTIASAFGLDLLMIRELARCPGAVSETFSSALWTRSVLWTTGLLLFLGASAVFRIDLETTKILFLLSVAGFATLLGNCSASVMASRELFWPRVVYEGVANLLRLGFAYGAVRIGFGVIGVAAAVCLASTIGAGAISFHAVRRFRIRIVGFSVGPIRQMMRQAAPFGLAGLVFSLYFRVHLILLSMLRGDTEAGLYGAAFKAVDAWILLPGSVMAAAYPLLSRSFGRDMELFERATHLLTRWMLTVTLAVASLVAADASGWITLVFGPGYEAAGLPLALLAIFLPLITLNTILGTTLYSAGFAKSVLWAELLALTVGIVSGVALILHGGLAGAAASAVIMELTVVLCNARSVRNQIGLSALRDSLQPGLPIAFGVGVLFFVIRIHPILELVGGFALSMVLFLWLGGVKPEDKIWLRENLPDGWLRELLTRMGILDVPAGAESIATTSDGEVRSA